MDKRHVGLSIYEDNISGLANVSRSTRARFLVYLILCAGCCFLLYRIIPEDIKAKVIFWATGRG